MCNASHKKELVKDAEANGNNTAEGSSKEVGQTIIDPLNLYASPIYETISRKSVRLESDNPIENARIVQNHDGKMMSEIVRKGEMELRDSDYPNMIFRQ